jgi:hypothetical protein
MTSCGSEHPAQASCGCGTRVDLVERRAPRRIDAPWTDGVVQTVVGEIPRARTRLSLRDRLGTLMVRSGIRRNRYRVPPGLYAVGSPTKDSPVLVSANYKLSFDRLRSVLDGRDGWILVLDTKGINVWCAAGKGTFGTAEIARRVHESGLSRVVDHRKLVVPQLGAPGVAAHEVHLATRFRVVYGPVRAEDLPAFLEARMVATPEMRRVRFPLRDRLVLVPVELVTGARYSLSAAAALLLVGGLSARGYTLASLLGTGLTSAALVLASFLVAQVLGPALLPWLPGRAFAVKGAVLGGAFAGMLLASTWAVPGLAPAPLHLAAWFALAPAITSFMLMNFTGASTYTSLSGVLREMRYAVPAQATVGAIGLVLWLTGLFVPGGPVR